LTAQRVRSPSGIEGINVFFYTHGADAAIDWSRPDITEIAANRPGHRFGEAIEVAPGGNAVLSYMELAAADQTTYEMIALTLESAESRIDGHDVVIIPGPISLKFATTIGLKPNAQQEYRMLRWRLLEVFGRQLQWRAGHPLVITERHIDAERVFELDPRSAERTRSLRQEEWTQHTLRVSDDIASEFELIHGSVRSHAAELLTGLSADEILKLGGYQVVDVTGRELQRWPALSTTADGQEELPGQVTGYWFGPREEIPPIVPGAPTGAVLPALGKMIDTEPCLDLIRVNYLWLPLSIAGAYTYAHSIGLQAGEKWRFVPSGENWPTIFLGELLQPLAPDKIRPVYGTDADARARHDRSAIQICLRRQELGPEDSR